MRKFFLLLFVSILLLVSCGPAVLPEDVSSATPEAATDPVHVLTLIPLDDPGIQFELDELIAMTEARTSKEILLLKEWHSQPVIQWNEEARYWVMYYALDPVVASRIYALVSVSQQRALDELEKLNIDYETRQPVELDAGILPMEPGCQPFECAVLVGAVEPILLYLFPEHKETILATVLEARTSLLASGTILPSDLDAIEEFGRVIASELVAERMNDGSADAKKFDSMPEGTGIWKPDPIRTRPEQPGWSKVTPWVLTSADQFRAPPPPEFGSPEFQAAVDEVRQTVLTNTPEQMEIAILWGDKRGTYTPAGHWNAIAAEVINDYQLSERDASHVFAALNMAMMDAGIACWDSKFHYFVVRPWQADPAIATLVGYPNHPSYPSGHSCFSGAAAETLSYFFPSERESLWAMAEEASISRLYGGLHYRFDLIAGKEIGRQVGALVQSSLISLQWNVFP